MSASGVTYQVGVNFQTDTNRAIGGVTRFNSKLQQMAGAYSVARRQQQHLIDGVNKLGNAARWSFTRLTLPMGIFGANLVKTHGQMESWRIAFRTVLRDVEKGDALMRRAVAFSVSTPFTTEAVVRRVQAHVGEEDEAPIEMLSRLGDIAAGVGRATDTGLTDMSRAYVKLLAKGRVDMESAEPFITAGAGVLRQAADMFYGGERERLYKAMERGEVKWTVMRDAIVAMTNEGGRFYRSMERQAEGILVSWAEVVSGFFVFRDALGEVIVKAYGLHGVLKSVTAWLLTSKDRIREWWNGASELTKGVVAVTGALALLSGPIFAVAAAISGLLVNFIVIGGAFVLWKKGIFSASGAAAGLAAVHGKAAAAGAALTGAATTAAAALRGVAASALIGPVIPPTAIGPKISKNLQWWRRVQPSAVLAGPPDPFAPNSLTRRARAPAAAAAAAKGGSWGGAVLTSLGLGSLNSGATMKGVFSGLARFGISALKMGAGLLRVITPLGALTTGAWLLYEGVAATTAAIGGLKDAADDEARRKNLPSVHNETWRGQYGDQRLITSKLGLTPAQHSAANLAADQQGMFFASSKGAGTPGYNYYRRRDRLMRMSPGDEGFAPTLLDPKIPLSHRPRLYKELADTPHWGEMVRLADRREALPTVKDGKAVPPELLYPLLARVLEESRGDYNQGRAHSDVSLSVSPESIRIAVREGVRDGWGEAFTEFMNERNGLND